MMQVYVDESGNLGADGRYFVIAVLAPNNPKRIKNIVKSCYKKVGKIDGNMPQELKGSGLPLPIRQDFVTRLIKKDDFSCSYIVADKTYLIPRIVKDKNICYNYLSAHLLRPILKGLSEDVQIIFDNHTVKVASFNSLKDYIRIEAYSKWNFQHELTIVYKNSIDYKNLQAIDVIANTIYKKYTISKKHPYRLMESKFQHRIKFPYKKFGT